MLLLILLLLLLQVAEAYGCARERGEQTPGLPWVRQTVPHQKAGQYCQHVPGIYWCEGYRYLCVGTDSVVGFFRCCIFSVMLGDIRKVKNLLIVAILYCSFLEKKTLLSVIMMWIFVARKRCILSGIERNVYVFSQRRFGTGTTYRNNTKLLRDYQKCWIKIMTT
jgi:hypothetical protein